MKKINIGILVVVLFSMSSCFKDRIELELNKNENVRLAVEAWITDLDERQSITLSLTSDYLNVFEPNFVNDAIVSLSFDQETIEFSALGNGVYAAPESWRAKTGKEYTLDIMHDQNAYTSSSLMRAMPVIDNVRAEFYEERDSIDYYDVYFGFQETPGEGDGYYGVDYKKGTADGDTLIAGGFTNDDFGDGVYYGDVTVTDEGYEIGDTVVLELYSIGVDASNFLLDVITEVFREGVFDPPPVNPRTNISNNALGYFITSGAQRFETVIE